MSSWRTRLLHKSISIADFHQARCASSLQLRDGSMISSMLGNLLQDADCLEWCVANGGESDLDQAT